eukprot:3202170-Lingulodinium_polyedra.AAC.1
MAPLACSARLHIRPRIHHLPDPPLHQTGRAVRIDPLLPQPVAGAHPMRCETQPPPPLARMALNDPQKRALSS